MLDVGETWHFTSQGVAGATSTAPDGTVANTVTVQAFCVSTGVPGCVSGTTVADTAVNRVTGSGRRHPDQEGDQRGQPVRADAGRGGRHADRAGARRRRRDHLDVPR